MKIDSDIIYGFVGSCLAPRFDNPKPIPKFHKELWEMCCSDSPRVAIAAPRGHAKSSSITLGYLLSTLLFEDKSYAIIVSDTEGQAVLFLNDLKTELIENEYIEAIFGRCELLKDNERDIIVRKSNGYKFRVQAKGSEQKVRGLKWASKRPDLIIGDDLENDEIVMNQDRREKFRGWLNKALIPALSDTGVIRIVGTVLHMDSALERILNDDEWLSKRYAAHNSDFSEILWPEKFSKERLMAERRRYVAQGMPEGYSQEYLNIPIDESSAYFRKADFRFYDSDEISLASLYTYSAIDFAISEKERADYTVIATVGVDSEKRLYVLDIRRGRWDAKEIIDEMFSVQEKYKPELFTAEDGMINKSIGPFLTEEMFKRNTFINLNPKTPVKDKQTRARPLQGRLRAGGMYFDKDAEWFPDLELEMLRFPRDVHDDQVDALAWIGLTLQDINEAPTAKQILEDEWEEEYQLSYASIGQNHYTGY